MAGYNGQVTLPGYDNMTGVGTPAGAAFLSGLRAVRLSGSGQPGPSRLASGVAGSPVTRPGSPCRPPPGQGSTSTLPVTPFSTASCAATMSSRLYRCTGSSVSAPAARAARMPADGLVQFRRRDGVEQHEPQHDVRRHAGPDRQDRVLGGAA